MTQNEEWYMDGLKHGVMFGVGLGIALSAAGYVLWVSFQ